MRKFKGFYQQYEHTSHVYPFQYILPNRFFSISSLFSPMVTKVLQALSRAYEEVVMLAS
jgi:hypothetical protein